MTRDVTVELKALRLHGMAGAWADLVEQGTNAGLDSARWLIEHLLQAEGTDRAMRSVSHQMHTAKFPVHRDLAGFDFEVSSDHYSPWLTEQGHAPYAWSVLGAVAQATERVELMTYVTCPILRYHPAVVAQKAATLQILADGRFTLGLGAGENLNEHVVGQGWPSIDVRQDMLAEAIDVIRELHGQRGASPADQSAGNPGA